MRVLVACEFSGVVRDAFAARGHEAWSSDIIPSETPGNHLVGDVRDVLSNEGRFDLVIAHPPCTYLTTTGARWFYHPEDRHARLADRRPHPLFPDRRAKRADAVALFMSFVDCAPRWAIENPIGCMSNLYRQPDQVIQPWQFGREASKATCLWLGGLPKLRPTKVVDRGERVLFASGKSMPKWYADLWSLPAKARAAARSRTFPEIAEAMADQWSEEALGNFIEYKQASIFDYLCRQVDATREDVLECA